MRDFTNIKRVIIKIGSSSLVDEQMNINYNIINAMMRTFKKLQSNNIEVALVTSGAIAVGMNALSLTSRPKDMGLKQACAAVGQAKLMEVYNEFASKNGINCGQILVNHDDFGIRKRMLHLSDTLDAMFKNNIIPIINENDALAVEEIKVGDNDTLAALIAPMINADLLILFSDIDGLYNKNPKVYSDAVLIHQVDRIDESIYACAGLSSSNVGTGGMQTKINAAVISTSAGSNMLICNSKEIASLENIIKGEEIGTLFTKNASVISSREHYIIFKAKAVGTICIDKGLSDALKEKKVSILPKGVTDVKGEFFKNTTVDVMNPEGEIVAKGIVSLSSAEIKKVLGQDSSRIKDILGKEVKKEIIHANNLVCIKEDIYGRTIK